ncbi:hypothetical protein LINPERPRIM_LOCUS16973, partial [Linum perenne]
MASSSGQGQSAARNAGNISADEEEPRRPFSPVPLPGPNDPPPPRGSVPGLHRFIDDLPDITHWTAYWQIQHLKPTPGVRVDFE